MANSACSFPFRMEDLMPWHVFDGKLFQKKYQQAHRGCSLHELLEGNRDEKELKVFTFQIETELHLILTLITIKTANAYGEALQHLVIHLKLILQDTDRDIDQQGDKDSSLHLDGPDDSSHQWNRIKRVCMDKEF
ncbi:hypothetical protein JD844_024799 [Phrynosoma platyrhinos]|uniref:Uncharacterized protein n=1 Tax=Phrynosoma platyrhinos TaxID=52577 RepID=A0ABQ7SYH7_PHRPL|nr:hypothetical protein JD844_024799 [Phrynosoma platyrhinos]